MCEHHKIEQTELVYWTSVGLTTQRERAAARSMRVDSTMRGLADDDDRARRHHAHMVATAERHGPDQQDTAERQNDDLENGEDANIQ